MSPEEGLAILLLIGLTSVPIFLIGGRFILATGAAVSTAITATKLVAAGTLATVGSVILPIGQFLQDFFTYVKYPH